MKNIESQINVEGTEDQVNELKRKQETIEDEIDEIIKKKQSADEVERILLEKQYRERIVTYHDLENQINDLLNKNPRLTRRGFSLLSPRQVTGSSNHAAF